MQAVDADSARSSVIIPPTDMRCSIPFRAGRPPPSATCLAKRRTMYLLDLAVADSTSLSTNGELLPGNPAAVEGIQLPALLSTS